jgi:hypothetical protein
VAGRREEPVTLLERVSADRIEDELNTPFARDLTPSLFEVLGPIVDSR